VEDVDAHRRDAVAGLAQDDARQAREQLVLEPVEVDVRDQTLEA
jgi:hypothetical protein